MTTPTDLAVDALAAHRLTRLITADVITQPPRGRLIRWAYRREAQREWRLRVVRRKHAARLVTEEIGVTNWRGWDAMARSDNEAPWLAKLITCRWCAGMYAAAGIVAARQLAPRWWRPAAITLALSSAAALLAGQEED